MILVFAVKSTSQNTNCENIEASSYYIKANQFSKSEPDSLNKYLIKFLKTKIELCENSAINAHFDNLKLKTLILLAEQEQQKENYIASIEYLDKIITPSTFVLNKQYIPQKQIDKLYAINYIKLKKDKAAIQHLLPHTMQQFKRGTDKQIVEFCIELLLENYDKEFLIKEYDKSIAQFYTKPFKHQSFEDPITFYYIKYLNVEIKLGKNNFWVGDLESITNYIKNQLFYKLLIK
jgi:hypothetical protein